MPHPFFEPIHRYFGFLQDDYGLKINCEEYDPEGFGSGLLRMESDRYFLDFQVEGMGPEVTLYAGRPGQRATDLAWIFAYLTRLVNPSPSGAAAWLYYFPYMTLGIWGEASVSWQLARLADILQSLWPAIFIFLDMDGPRSADFLDFKERAGRAAAEQTEDGYRFPAAQIAGRESLNFAPQVQKSFAFLSAYGFQVVHADPIFVRYEAEAQQQRPAMYINVFHRLHSYQLGLNTGPLQSDPSFELNFDLSELAAWMGEACPTVAVKTAAELPAALNRLARFFRRCSAPALAGDPRLFEALHTRRIDAARRASRAWAERSRR